MNKAFVCILFLSSATHLGCMEQSDNQGAIPEQSAPSAQFSDTVNKLRQVYLPLQYTAISILPAIQAHKRNQKLDAPRNFICKQCPYKGSSQRYLDNHMLTHTRKDRYTNIFGMQYKCTFKYEGIHKKCSYKSYHPENLRKHIARHTAPFIQCTECDKFSSQDPSNIKAHKLRMHGILE